MTRIDDLAGKRDLITGASSGIGAAAARLRLAGHERRDPFPLARSRSFGREPVRDGQGRQVNGGMLMP